MRREGGAQTPAACSRKKKRELLFLLGFGVLAAKSLDSSSRIHNLLLTRKKRMAGRADFHVDIAFVSGTGGKRASTCAANTHFIVCGMNTCLHNRKLTSPKDTILQEQNVSGKSGDRFPLPVPCFPSLNPSPLQLIFARRTVTKR